jgi:hypothetical protein
MGINWKEYRLQVIAMLPTQTNAVVATSVIRVVEHACPLPEAYARAKVALNILGVESQDVRFFNGMSIEDIYTLIS